MGTSSSSSSSSWTREDEELYRAICAKRRVRFVSGSVLEEYSEAQKYRIDSAIKDKKLKYPSDGVQHGTSSPFVAHTDNICIVITDITNRRWPYFFTPVDHATVEYPCWCSSGKTFMCFNGYHDEGTMAIWKNGVWTTEPITKDDERQQQKLKAYRKKKAQYLGFSL